MTKEEALNIMSQMIKDEEVFLSDNTVEAHKMAIQALSQEPCEDAISREELLKAIDTWDKFGYTETGCFVKEPKCDYVPYIHYDDVIKCIKGMPTVTQKSGKWVEIDDEPHEVWECDHCGFVIDGSGCIEPYEYRDTYNYCPNCGARMVEPQESEDKI